MGGNPYDHIVNSGLWCQDYALFRVDSSRARNHRALIVSDAPETLYPWEPNLAWDMAHGVVTGEYEVYGTLYCCEVPANNPSDYRFRMYLWHENRLNPPPEATVATFGIAVSSANQLVYGCDLVYRAVLANSAANATPFGVALVGRGTPSGFTGASLPVDIQ